MLPPAPGPEPEPPEPDPAAPVVPAPPVPELDGAVVAVEDGVVPLVALAVAAVNVIPTDHPVIESVVSVAAYVTDSGTVSVTSKAAIPLLSVVTVGEADVARDEAAFGVTTMVAVGAGAAVTTELPADGVNDTVFPLTGDPLASLRVTVTIAAVFPSATTLALLTTALESPWAGTTGGGVPKVTDASWERISESLVSVAE